MATKRLDPSKLITHKFPLKDYKKAFDMLALKSESHAIKVLFDFTGIK